MKHLFRLYGSRSCSGDWSLASGEFSQSIKVLRFTAGQKFEIFDGCGWVATAVITEMYKREFAFEVIEDQYRSPSDCSVSIAIGALKKGALEDVLPFLVEVGTSDISIFLQAGHESYRLQEKQVIRLNKIVVEAAKVSKRAYLPRMSYYQSFDDFRDSVSLFQGSKFILDPDAELGLESAKLESRVLLCIGSEQGLSPEESEVLVSCGFNAVSIGDNTLRAKTAAVAAVVVCASRHGWR